MLQQPELWIGLVEVRPLNRKSYGATVAFTNIITWACDAKEFRKKAEIIVAAMDLYVAEIENLEPFAEETKKSTLLEEIDDMVQRAESNPNYRVDQA